MTEKLKGQMKQILGEGTGASRYRQLKELAPYAGVPLGKNRRGTAVITEETIVVFKTLTNEQWEKALAEYRREYRERQLVLLSSNGVNQIRRVLRGL